MGKLERYATCYAHAHTTYVGGAESAVMFLMRSRYYASLNLPCHACCADHPFSVRMKAVLIVWSALLAAVNLLSDYSAANGAANSVMSGAVMAMYSIVPAWVSVIK